MKLKNPNQVRQLFAERCKLYTINEIADTLKVSNKTVSNSLSGKPMYPATVRKFAELLRVEATDIATFMS